MENNDATVRAYLTALVSEALAGEPPQLAVRYAQGRFVKGDPISVICSWPGLGSGPSKEFIVAFSGEAVTNFVTADEARLAKLRAAALAAIAAQHKAFDPARGERYPFLCQIDYLGV